MANPENEVTNKPESNGVSVATVEIQVPGKPGRKKLPRDEQGNIIREKAELKISAKKSAPSEPRPDQLLSAKFLGKGANSLLEMVESFNVDRCTSKIARVFPEKLNEFAELTQKTSLKSQEKELISSCIEQIAIRHEWMTKFAPEIVLGIVLSEYGMRQLMLVRFVNTLTIPAERVQSPAQRVANVQAPKETISTEPASITQHL